MSNIVKQIDVKIVAQYNGHTIKPSGAVDLNIKVEYGEMVNAIATLQLLNNDIMSAAKFPNEKAFKLGAFRLKTVNFGSDGESKICFNSTTDFVETDNLNKLIPLGDNEKFLLRLKAAVELENGNDDEEE